MSSMCPYCGKNTYARGGEVEGGLERKKGHGMKGGIHRDLENTGSDLPYEDDVQWKRGQGRKGGIYADGGEVEPTAWRKREVDLPRHELDTYRGEGVPRGEATAEDDEEEKRLAYAREIRRRRGY